MGGAGSKKRRKSAAAAGSSATNEATEKTEEKVENSELEPARSNVLTDDDATAIENAATQEVRQQSAHKLEYNQNAKYKSYLIEAVRNRRQKMRSKLPETSSKRSLKKRYAS